MNDDPMKKDPDAEYGDEPGIPHFQRRDNRYIDYAPSDNLWEVLPHLDDEELLGLGLQPWDEDHQIWLFPVEWYDHIPDGLEVITITEEIREFDRDNDLKEARFGSLPYGIHRPDYEPSRESSDLGRVDR